MVPTAVEAYPWIRAETGTKPWVCPTGQRYGITMEGPTSPKTKMFAYVWHFDHLGLAPGAPRLTLMDPARHLRVRVVNILVERSARGENFQLAG